MPGELQPHTRRARHRLTTQRLCVPRTHAKASLAPGATLSGTRPAPAAEGCLFPNGCRCAKGYRDLAGKALVTAVRGLSTLACTIRRSVASRAACELFTPLTDQCEEPSRCSNASRSFCWSSRGTFCELRVK